jgi:hypothetical protein
MRLPPHSVGTSTLIDPEKPTNAGTMQEQTARKLETITSRHLLIVVLKKRTFAAGRLLQLCSRPRRRLAAFM